MTTCFGYVRVSTQKQGDGASLAAQKDAITGFASQNGLTVTEWFEELETASKRGRPFFDAMVARLRKHEAQGVIVHRWDRTARNYSDWGTISDLADAGVKVFCAGDNIDFGSRSGRLMADIQMVFATDYSRNLSIEVKKGQAQRLKEGYWPWCAPLGYVNNGEGQLKTPCPKKAVLVKKAFRLYLSGEYSITSLTEEMRRRGLKNFDNGPLTRANVECLLRNPYYCGLLECRQGSFKGVHKPLITVAQFTSIQDIKQRRYVKKVTKHRFLFRGLIRCGKCEAVLVGERQRTHIYYRCHTKSCPEPSYREDRIEQQIEHQLAELQWSDETVAEFRNRIQQRDIFAELDEQRASLNLRAAEIQARTTRLTDLYIDGKISEADHEMRKKVLKLDLAVVDEERTQLARKRTSSNDIETIIEFASSIYGVYVAGASNDRRRTLRAAFLSLTANGNQVLGIPVDELCELEGSRTVEKRMPTEKRGAAFDA